MTDNNSKVLEIITELEEAMREKGLSCSSAALFLRVSSKQIDRWLRGEATPTMLYREAIKRGIKRIKKL